MVDGYAQLNLQEIMGKAQTGAQALHAFPGDLLLGHCNPTLGLLGLAAFRSQRCQ